MSVKPPNVTGYDLLEVMVVNPVTSPRLQSGVLDNDKIAFEDFVKKLQDFEKTKKWHNCMVQNAIKYYNLVMYGTPIRVNNRKMLQQILENQKDKSR